MNEIPHPDHSSVDVPDPRSADRPRARDDAGRAAARRRRLAEVFGDVLPSTTSDERGDPDGQGADRDAWLRSQVPPHHGPTR